MNVFSYIINLYLGGFESSLCHHYRHKLVRRSVQSDQAIYSNRCLTILLSLKSKMDISQNWKMEKVHLRNSVGNRRILPFGLCASVVKYCPFSKTNLGCAFLYTKSKYCKFGVNRYILIIVIVRESIHHELKMR